MTPEEALARAESEGIRRLRIPTPFAVGRVNCYLIEDEPLTLVDTGPNSGKALDELEHQLADLGREIADIDLVVLTHQHIDHLGLVEIIASRSGADVAAIDVAVPYLESYSEGAEADDEFASALMLRYGIPEDMIDALRSVSRSFRGWGATAKVTRPLRDGEALAFRDRSLEVQHRPGHSPSDTLFWDSDRRILLAADHLIAHISSNPLLTRPLDGSGERPRALLRYLESLRRTRELPAEIVLPGHGEPVTDHRALIDERLAMHQRRAERIHGLIAERPRTAFELAQEMWGNVAVTQAFLTLSEVVGHVDLLIEDGRVREVADGAVVRFETSGVKRASSENVEIVRRSIEAWNRGDLDAWTATLHPAVEFDWSRSRAPFKGVYRGHDGIQTFWRLFWSTFQDVRIEMHRFTQAGSEVVVSNTAHMRGREGIEVIARSALVHRVENGQITRLRLFQEEAEGLEAVGLSGQG